MTTYGGSPRRYSTADPRIRIVTFGADHWRTEVRDDAHSTQWAITGPLHKTRSAAERTVSDVLAVYFGEGPTREGLERENEVLAADLTDALQRVGDALLIAQEGGSYQLATRIVRALKGTP
jgi:hypothetical protein